VDEADQQVRVSLEHPTEDQVPSRDRGLGGIADQVAQVVAPHVSAGE
jgi:hypothetical protein